MESRDAYVALQTDFPTGETTPIVVLATVQGDPTSAANATALAAYARQPGGLPGITHVESPYSLTDPTTGAALTPTQVGQLYALPAASRPAAAEAAISALQQAYVRGTTVRFNAISSLDPASPQATAMIPTDPGARGRQRDHDPGRGRGSDRPRLPGRPGRADAVSRSG